MCWPVCRNVKFAWSKVKANLRGLTPKISCGYPVLACLLFCVRDVCTSPRVCCLDLAEKKDSIPAMFSLPADLTKRDMFLMDPALNDLRI